MPGITLCKAKRFVEAERASARGLAIDRNCWPTHYGMTLLYLSTGNRDRARTHTERLESLLERRRTSSF